MTSVPHSGAKSVTPGGSVAGHTRGPWEVLRIEDCLAIMPDPITGRPDTFLGIAVVQEHDGERSASRVEANARLIAAAPDLLEALREARVTIAMLRRNVLTEIKNHDGLFRWEGIPEALQGRIAECDAALTKATAGETRNAELIHRRDGDEG